MSASRLDAAAQRVSVSAGSLARRGALGLAGQLLGDAPAPNSTPRACDEVER